MLGSEARFPLKADWLRIAGSGLPAGSLAALEPPLVCFPLRGEWEALRGSERAAYPAPERTSRDGAPADIPSAVGKLAQFAREASWEVRVQESVGNVPHGSTGRPTGLKRLIALRFGAHPMTDRQAYVVYETTVNKVAWKPRSIMIWGPDLNPYAHCGMNELRTYLRDLTWHDTRQINAWVAAIEKARREVEAFQKRRTAARAQIRKVADDGRFRAGQAETRQEYAELDAAWRSKVADLQDGLFTSEEVAQMIDPDRRRAPSRQGMS